MNKTEAEYAAFLETAKTAGAILNFWWDALGLRMASKTHYRTDFLVMRADGTLELHEVKGHMEDDAWVKLKVIAEMYPFPVFVVKKVAKCRGTWTWTQVGDSQPTDPKQFIPADAVAVVATRIKSPKPAKQIAWPK